MTSAFFSRFSPVALMQRLSLPEQLNMFEQLCASQEKHVFPLGTLEGSTGRKHVLFYLLLRI